MWPLCLIANRILKMEAEDAIGEDVGGVGFAVLADCAGVDDGGGGGEKRGLSSAECSRSRSVDVISWFLFSMRSLSIPVEIWLDGAFFQVPHVRQISNWDCGLACVLMVLRTLGVGDCDIHDLRALCPTTSIWTIDLAYLLHKFSVTFTFFTVTIGANPNFSAEAFYKEQLQDDLERVESLFTKAVEVGIDIQCRSISGKDISSLILSGNYIALTLVDKYKLSNNSWLKDIYISGSYSSNIDYIGHYILICGYDQDTNQFEIRDPASSRKNERVSSRCLEEARKSFGTDEDILLIYLSRYDGESDV